MSMPVKARYADYVYALLRITSGLMFAFHGSQKILGILAASRPPVGSQLWVGGLIELAGGLAIAAGFQTRLAAFICSGMMAVAYTQFHWKLRLGAQLLPAVNQGELALLYALLLLYVSVRGGVKWCVDKR
jgi:putative oxidoreductase